MLDKDYYHNSVNDQIEQYDGQNWSQKCHEKYNCITEKAAEKKEYNIITAILS